MADKAAAASPRINELTKRLQREPSSRLFLELAREYYSAGSLEDAARMCRDGLQKHPSYHSARVLLGRALIDLGRFVEARPELERVVKQAPENLLARRLLGEALTSADETQAALRTLRDLLTLAPDDRVVSERIRQIELESAAPASPAAQAAPPEAEAAAEPGPPESGVETVIAAVSDIPPPPQAPPSNAGLETSLDPGVETLPAVPLAAPAEEPVEAHSTAAEEWRLTAPPEVEGAVLPAAAAPTASFGPGADEAGEDTAALFAPPYEVESTAQAGPPETPCEAEAIASARPQEVSDEGRKAPVSGSAETAALRFDQSMFAPRPSSEAEVPAAVAPAEEAEAEAIPTKTLAEVYLAQGMGWEALEIYRKLLDASPDDDELAERVRSLTEALEPASTTAVATASAAPSSPAAAPAPPVEPAPGDEETTVGALPTPTLAEIYLARGQVDRALEIYRQVLVGDPYNHEVEARVRDLTARLVPPGSPTERRIRALQGWLETMRRPRHVQDHARGSGAPPAGM